MAENRPSKPPAPKFPAKGSETRVHEKKNQTNVLRLPPTRGNPASCGEICFQADDRWPFPDPRADYRCANSSQFLQHFFRLDFFHARIMVADLAPTFTLGRAGHVRSEQMNMRTTGAPASGGLHRDRRIKTIHRSAQAGGQMKN